MGEQTEFEEGQRAPNPGVYVEVGEARSFHTQIENPKRITLEKGDKFPETTNKNRKWKKEEKARVH
ncbi:MAG: YjzC family protein [Paenibacillus macerans]|uniref:YjzC family protein n=1 Tax=Paenibacillus macerans TaxID=44252 RepID=A0A091A6Y4_PAEMA|nr:YjzC family protein [Paenibacillus macerans]KFN12001.1 yjzC-like family protein [Paenibacillus macerans]MBS5912397.1 YjzC family protein [Paenibacillus macerans]MCY7559067.1 YjzC family protein [Paenibacillus macerans]MDU5946010.1 YjzC family protein [Paenibacillus macerans]MDU7472092.1 YjzC family protein [Paenibacillus macerans]